MATKMENGSSSEKRNIRELERRRANREAILLAAEAVICRKGLIAASMDDVAAEAGFSKATIYKYVRGKSELVSELLIHFMEEWTDRLTEIAARPLEPEPKFLVFLREIIRYQAEKENISRAFLLDRSHLRIFRAMEDKKGHSGTEAERAFFRLLLTARKALASRMESFIREGIAAGAFRSVPVDSAVHFLTAVVLGYQHDRMFRDSKPDLEKDVLDVYGFILHGIKAEIQVNA
jgi:AcrR family transcriptional regulator